MSTHIEKYRKRLASFNFDKEDEDEILNFCYSYVKEFISTADKKHPVQQALHEREKKHFKENEGVIDSDNRNIQSSFRNASDGQDR